MALIPATMNAHALGCLLMYLRPMRRRCNEGGGGQPARPTAGNEVRAHLDQNLLGPLRRGSPGLDSGSLGWLLLGGRTARSTPVLLFGRKLGTRKSGVETNTENEAQSGLLARLWCHLPLQNPANRAENLTRLCSATIGQTGWRMVQFGAIRSRQKAVQLLAEILKQKIQWRFRRFRVSRV